MSESTRSKQNPRATYRVPRKRASKAVCHRIRDEIEQYLIVWARDPPDNGDDIKAPTLPVCSWHSLPELTLCLEVIQRYITSLDEQRPSTSALKRKTADEGRSSEAGLLTPSASSQYSRASSASEDAKTTIKSKANVAASIPQLNSLVFNGLVEKRAGRFVCKRPPKCPATLDPDNLPLHFIEEAKTTPVSQGREYVRVAFVEKLAKLKRVRLENRIDTTVPSLDFDFISEFVLGANVYRADAETVEGCDKPCRPDMGQNVGCEYTRLCSCLEFADVDVEKLEKSDPGTHRAYMQSQAAGEDFLDWRRLPKKFPYKSNRTPQGTMYTLAKFYRDSRRMIYECNRNCNCGPGCKSRLVQKGRTVPLTVFKTMNRGWGVYSSRDLRQGEFVDTYVGEVITNAEADAREDAARSKSSYLYTMDKFVSDEPGCTIKDCFVVDGERMGNVTRFINHSCEPNLRQFTVSYNKYDRRIYDLAFFAIEDIPAGTELTFDYLDLEEEQVEAVREQREQQTYLNSTNATEGAPPTCNCGAETCRGYLWS